MLARGLALGLVISGAGCTVPIVVCEEHSERQSIRFGPEEVELLSSGAFRIHGVAGEDLAPQRRGEFSACAELCRREEGVREVERCTAPAQVDARFSGDAYGNAPPFAAPSWRMECKVTVVRCAVPGAAVPVAGPK